MSDNMKIYSAARIVPADAIKKITAGAYGAAGLSDINPQWRIERMTEIFGPVGIGWTWDPVETTLDDRQCYMHIVVKYATEKGWSEPIHGYGGTKVGGKDDSDIFKSTATDAISNALRYLGIGADVWYAAGGKSNQFDTKYSAPPQYKMATAEQLAFIVQNFSEERIEAMLKHYRVASTDQLTATEAAMVIAKRKKEMAKEG